MSSGLISIITVAVVPLAWYLVWRIRYGRPFRGWIPVLAYHKVDDRFEWGGTWITPARFRSQMGYLKSQGLTAVTLSRAVELMRRGEAEPGRYVCITFDDAYQGLMEHAWPVLKEFGFAATIFVVTDYAGRVNDWDVNWGGRRFRHLNWEEMLKMSQDGIEFGSHGCRHRDLRRLKESELKRELAESKKMLEEKLGVPARTLSYPFGRYDLRVMQAASDCGYEAACSLSSKGRNDRLEVMALRRSAVYVTDTEWNLKNMLDPERPWYWLQEMWGRTVNFCSGGTILAKRLLKDTNE
jgi:peptidoglycan/xylan/chitin deacetylase (PgdA/CDA1 family)